ncbi:hypothetical protein GUJ93_ZPchr0012g20268 [Zizania palustris]|uniref:Uncharacterized protein n=1 Tax=Zizania palustris TaxID=103762 RepID=A0A8J6BS93_ZIZPA|nr:hypothetical protein GUJ93_ZPchr0012g20268 [Zizania palustris]
MDDHTNEPLRDLFSQPYLILPSIGYEFFSQMESSQDPRHGMQALDLNSQVEDFTSYSELLRGDGYGTGCTSGTLVLRVPRNGGGRVTRGGGHQKVVPAAEAMEDPWEKVFPSAESMAEAMVEAVVEGVVIEERLVPVMRKTMVRKMPTSKNVLTMMSACKELFWALT